MSWVQVLQGAFLPNFKAGKLRILLVIRTITLSNTKKKEITQKTESLKDGIKNYLKGVKSEWGKITWPERKQVIAETLVVLGVVFFFTLVVFILDKLFQLLLGLIPNR